MSDSGRRATLSQPPVRRLILLRHGQTHYNATGRMQGQLDTELSDVGVAQAKRAASALGPSRPRLIIASDLRRALDTATAVGEQVGLAVDTDVRLRETHLGRWQGMTHVDVDAEAPGARARWRDDARWRPPGGESRVDVAARAVPVVAELVDGVADWGRDGPARSPVLVVAHGGVIAAMTASLLDLPESNWPMFGGLANTSWVQLSGYGDEPVWRLDVWNASAEDAGSEPGDAAVQ